MDSMPNEILELIFAHIPMTDLFKVHSLVCKNWKNVISRELYMPWKKSYYRYKLIGRRDMNNLEGECFTKLKAAISQNFPELKSVHMAIPIECLREIAEKLPTTKAEMLEIDQMTHFRFDKFGAHLLEVCKDFKAPNLSKIKSEKPPAKKSKIEYESDDTDDDDDVKNDVNSLDMKLRSLYGQIRAFSNDYINIKNHLHPPVADSKVTDKFRLETAAPWLINFVRNEFEREDRFGQFRSVYCIHKL